jgi:hypothetical protein
VWQIDYSAVAPIVEDTLQAVGDELAAAFSVGKITWNCLHPVVNKTEKAALPPKQERLRNLRWNIHRHSPMPTTDIPRDQQSKN